MRAVGVVGGQSTGLEWGAYAGMVLCKAKGSVLGASEVVDRVQAMWRKFSHFANAQPYDWTKRNTAYYAAEGGEVVVWL